MNIIDKIAKWFGYKKIIKDPESGYTVSGEPYCKNGIWYGVYDHITGDNLTENEINEIAVAHEIYFRLSPAEWLRFNKFKENHKHKDEEVILDGPKYWIGFGSGGGIGKCVYVKCAICGKTYDLTDISDW